MTENDEEVSLLSFLSLFHVLFLSPSLNRDASLALVLFLSPFPSLFSFPSPSLWTGSDSFCGGMQERESDGTWVERERERVIGTLEQQR